MSRLEHYLGLIENHRRWLLLAQLAVLHLVLVQDVASPIARTLLLVHIGLFLLWQPIVRAEKRLNRLELALIAVLVVAAAMWTNVWVMMAWVMVLAGIVGGKVFFSESLPMRLFYLLALTYLVLALLVLLTPRIIPRPPVLPDVLGLLAHFGLPILFAVMALLPVPRDESQHSEVIDFAYSAFLFLLLAVLVLGTLALMLLSDKGYVEALAIALVSVSGVLFVLGWAWNPRSGFSGLGLVFSRYVLSVGLPFEDWLHELTELSAHEADADAFLARACASLSRFPGVTGGKWRAGGEEGRFGEDGERHYPFKHGTLVLTLYSRRNLGPALVWHFQLLAQVVGEFHLAKVRSRQVQQLSYLQAVHETGARLTHDVKNLLQSLNALCFAAEREGDEISPQFHALLRRQLPVISQRLQQTLDKLRQPVPQERQEVPARQWWAEVERQFQHGRIRFFAIGMRDGDLVPKSLFNRALENLIENALRKQATLPSVAISATLDMTDGVVLSVCDTGAPIPPAIAKVLFRAPVPSESGLGIGLYQVARQAEWYGHRLQIAANEPGQVCIKLERHSPDAAEIGAAPDREASTNPLLGPDGSSDPI